MREHLAMADRLIVALDVPSIDAARALVQRLDGVVSFYKIGLWLLYSPGAERFIDELIASGRRIFLDAKMYDIGETVRQGVARAVERGVSFITVHGDPEIMRAAVDGKRGASGTAILAVSVLTSLDEQAMRAMGYGLPLPELVRMRVRQAVQAGCEGIIASAADDLPALRRDAGAEHMLFVTPGVREPGAGSDDHKRHTTPAHAIGQGADYLVVGRPIAQAEDPAAAARRIVADMAHGAALTGR